MAVGNEGTVKYCDKGNTEGDLEFVVPATAGVVESVDLTVIVWSEFVLGDLEFAVPVESVDLMACVGSFEKSVFISPKLSVSVTKTLNHLFKIQYCIYLSGKVALAAQKQNAHNL